MRNQGRSVFMASAGRRFLSGLIPLLFLLLVYAVVDAPVRAADQTSQADVALSLANMLRAGRTVIARNQALINDADKTDKGLTGDVVLAAALKIYQEKTGLDPVSLDKGSLHGRLLDVQMTSIREVIDEHQSTINKPAVAFKGFVPAVFARLTNEKFKEKIGEEAEIKVTAPLPLVRNRKALPDDWETSAIDTRLTSSDWPKDQAFSESASKNGRKAFRVLVPEYYSQNCLSCHGEPKGEVDITGYPREGGQLGQLGGVISITLYE